MIEVLNLTKKYGNNVGINNISFKITQGEIVGLLGPNGAGKSTMMNLLTGYISKTSGKIMINGQNLTDNLYEIRFKIGYLPEQTPLYEELRVDEYLNFVYSFKKTSLSRQKHLEDICNRTGITDIRKRLIRNLSKGYKQRVGLAQALMGNPEILMLDEPTIGLDPLQIIEIRNMIKKLSCTVILSSHILSEVQEICERVIVINEGSIIADNNISQLQADDQTGLQIRVMGDREEVLQQLSALDGVLEIECVGEIEPGSLDYTLHCDRDVRKEIFNRLAEITSPALMIKPIDLTLEQVFIKLTKTK